MKQGNKQKAGEVAKEYSRSGNRHSKREKVRHNEDNNSSLLAGSVWKTTNFHDHNVLVYPNLPTYRKIYSEVQNRRLTAMKLSSWLPRMIHLKE